MWIYAVGAVALAAVWVAGYFLKWSIGVRVALSVCVLFAVIGVVLLRVWRARRAARALERDLLAQAERQAMSVRPDRRAAVTELQHNFKQAIDSLRSSRLGARGADALYALPWYVIIGPPGAGKTTALKQSGLNFPLLGEGGGLRGVGGTRNCDWWFADDAVLLDTAGRYASESDDHEEWTGFLDLLRRHRAQKPINGVIVGISVTDIAQASEQELDEKAKRLRARVDDLMTRLEMVVPVYVMLTKADLIGGFVEFWGDVRKSERGQVWGATMPLGTPIDDVGRRMRDELALLGSSLHARAVARLATETSAEARARLFQFPLEFATLQENVANFVEAMFQKNSYQDSPILRGVYFTSGTQEGRPMERVVAEMSKAFGVKRPETAGPLSATESKSYFVTDLFRRVVIPDREIASRSAREEHRLRWRTVAWAGSALALAMLLLVPAAFTYRNNVERIDLSARVGTRANEIRWGGDASAEDNATRLNALRDLLRQLDDEHENGPPVSLAWGMYQGDQLRPALRRLYVGQVQAAFAEPVRKSLDMRLRGIEGTSASKGEAFSTTYDDLKTYLMLGDEARDHLDEAWVVPRLLKTWSAAEQTALTPDLDAALRPHVAYYVEMVKRGEVPAWKSDKPLVAKTRSALMRVPQVEREYDALVRDANAEIAPIRFADIFYGSSVAFVTSTKTPTVDGAYTKQGWERVRELLDERRDVLLGETWVRGEQERTPGDDVKKQVGKLRELYFERYKGAWRDFLLSVEVHEPENASKALDELNALSETEWPYLRLLRTVAENTALEPAASKGEARDKLDALVDKGKAAAEKKAEKATGMALSDPTSPAKVPPSPVELAFRPIARFAIGDASAKPTDTPPVTGLAQYQAVIGKLVGVLSDLRDSKAAPDPKALGLELEQAYRMTSTLLATQDGFTRPLLSPLLMRPIALTWSAINGDVGGGNGGLWEMLVWQKWDDQLAHNYPFDPAARTDATLADFTDFFKPKTGVVWGFYDGQLKSTLDREGDHFVPSVRFKSSVPYSSPFLSCLKRVNQITEATFQPGGATEMPAVEFDVRLQSVSSEIAEVTLEIDGVSHTYRNEPEEWLHVQWPAKDAKARGAAVRVHGAHGLDEQIIRVGDFGLFRLLDAAIVKPTTASKPGASSSFTASWELKTLKGAFVRIEIRPSRDQTPLDVGFFKSIVCPRLIVGKS